MSIDLDISIRWFRKYSNQDIPSMRNWADTYHQQMDRFTQSFRHKSLRLLHSYWAGKEHTQGTIDQRHSIPCHPGKWKWKLHSHKYPNVSLVEWIFPSPLVLRIHHIHPCSTPRHITTRPTGWLCWLLDGLAGWLVLSEEDCSRSQRGSSSRRQFMWSVLTERGFTRRDIIM